MAIKKKLVALNVVSSASQVLFIGLVYFLLYRFLLKQVGVELLGVWSVVLSTSSLANLANFGVADSVIRFVALFTKEGDDFKIKQLIFTAVIFLGLLFLLIASIIYPFADLILKSVLPIKFLKDGLAILPYSLACLVLNAVNGVFASVLDGMQRNYLRNIIFTFSAVMLLVLAYLLVPKYHLQGVAFAQLCQSAIALLSCMSIVIVQTRYNPFKWYWSKSIFKQIFSYGMKFQFVSLATMLNEPVTKILLGKFGGMAFAGYYEMANRVLVQAKGVIVSATQSLVPVMVHLSDDLAEIQNFYRKVFSNVLFFTLTAVGIIMIAGHAISFYWIGSYQDIFYNTLAILALSMFVNILNSPAYFFYMAEGNLNVLIKTHLILGITNFVCGYALGYFFLGYGVVFGWFLAILIGSVYMLMLFNRMYHIKASSLFNKYDIAFISAIILLIVLDNTVHFMKDLKINDLVGLGIMMIITALYFVKFKMASILSLKKAV